jgi:beta-galactosidase
LLWVIGASLLTSVLPGRCELAGDAGGRPEVMALSRGARTLANFDRDWLFSLADYPNAAMPAYDDASWRRLNLPHDWSIEGAFATNLASSTGYLPGGIGWYRKHFLVDSSARGKIVAIEFDGIYNHSEVWLNGFLVGGRPYGYSGFSCDLTPYLRFGGEENVIAVRVDHSQFANSRWYTGSGIYRQVRLRFTDPLHIDAESPYITTPEVSADASVVQIETILTNSAGAAARLSLRSDIVAPDGREVGSLVTAVSLDGATNLSLVQSIPLAHPELWTLTNPCLYTLHSRLSANSNTVDETSTTFGIRTLRFDPDKGFFLNGQSLKIKGVCIHHDAGCLGAAVPEKVLERRLRQLRDLGVNAIRTSHNPPAPELLDLCDRLGLLVKDEAFDEFTPGKNKWVTGRNDGIPARFGYAEDFEQWAIRDAQDMVRRDRNHPSVFMWSIGNEIDYANDPFSHPILGEQYRPGNPRAETLFDEARLLVIAVKQIDATRPVTMALANVAMSDAVGLGELLDIVGYNYQEWRYAADHAKYPRRFIFGSETSQQYQDWAAVRDHEYVAGQFLWTGIDYLGEAGRWPNHGSGAGLLDLCGFKKPLAWFRQSLWSDQPMVYLCVSREAAGESRRGWRLPVESWTWPTNAALSVHCFTTCSEVQLLVNGRSLGVLRRADATNGVLTWSVPFEPGEIKAIGQEDGKAVCAFALRSAGLPSRIELSADRNRLDADGRDVAQVEFSIVDANGVRVPDAESEVDFEVAGPGKMIGLENGNLNTTEPYGTKRRASYHGRGLAILQSTTVGGEITLKASSPQLAPVSITISSR